MKLSTYSMTLLFGPQVVNTIAVCSGSGGYEHFYEAQQAAVDMYITGEAIEVCQTAKDSKMNVIFAGHSGL